MTKIQIDKWLFIYATTTEPVPPLLLTNVSPPSTANELTSWFEIHGVRVLSFDRNTLADPTYASKLKRSYGKIVLMTGMRDEDAPGCAPLAFMLDCFLHMDVVPT